MNDELPFCQVYHPILAEAGARVERRFGIQIETSGGIGDFCCQYDIGGVGSILQKRGAGRASATASGSGSLYLLSSLATLTGS